MNSHHRAALFSMAIAASVDYTIQRRSGRRYDVKRGVRVGSENVYQSSFVRADQHRIGNFMGSYVAE